MTPQAARAPALPVLSDSSALSPVPRPEMSFGYGALLESGRTEVIGAGVNDERASDHRVGTVEGDQRIGDLESAKIMFLRRYTVASLNITLMFLTRRSPEVPNAISLEQLPGVSI